ncbi:transcription initiation factor IID, 18kD subunit-domain-containing protein [Cunninghamella echinulata]|nr:transcription initiation factor IID, 18kD subunit-domain-containing protein [Cunninghamella echinulata]
MNENINKDARENRDTKESKESKELKDKDLKDRETGGGPGRRKTVRKGMFAKDLKLLMYGFGDDPNPSGDSIALMDDLVIDYIIETCQKVAKLSESRGKIRVEDFKFVLRKDPKKLARIEELIYMNEDIRRAKQIFDDKEMAAEETPSK